MGTSTLEKVSFGLWGIASKPPQLQKHPYYQPETFLLHKTVLLSY